MPPKTTVVNEEETEETMSEEATTISKQQKLIMEWMGEIKALRRQNEERDRGIALLECRVSELEQYYRINDVVASGLETTYWSYARVTAAESGDPPEPELHAWKQKAVAFFDSRGINVESKDIEGRHPLPGETKNETPAIMTRFVNRKQEKSCLNRVENWKEQMFESNERNIDPDKNLTAFITQMIDLIGR